MDKSVLPPACRENVPLAGYTTLGIGGPARFLLEARAESDVVSALEFAGARDLPIFVLGGGSNLVVADDGYPGLVLRIALKGITHEANGLVVAAAGEDWDGFVRHCVESRLAGIECLSGIPGTVGGTPVQNVGAYGQEVSETILSVRALDRRNLRVVELGNAECGFEYRASAFNTSARERYVILAVTFALQPDGAPRLAYPDLERRFSGIPGTPALADVRAAVLHIRETKSLVVRPEDPDARSAGSFFKNPILPAERWQQFQEAARRRLSPEVAGNLPRYPVPGGGVKLSAAWLIEHAGFPKGYLRGRVGLSGKHALVLVNRGGATARELLDLMGDIQTAVRDLFEVDLAPEPMFVGFGQARDMR